MQTTRHFGTSSWVGHMMTAQTHAHASETATMSHEMQDYTIPVPCGSCSTHLHTFWQGHAADDVPKRRFPQLQMGFTEQVITCNEAVRCSMCWRTQANELHSQGCYGACVTSVHAPPCSSNASTGLTARRSGFIRPIRFGVHVGAPTC